MNPAYLYTAGIAAAVAAALTFVIVRLLDRLRKKDAETESRRILQQAEKDAANRIKEAELEIKETALQQKTKSEAELSELREELRQRERLSDKREEVLTQQTEDLRKQERIVENTQSTNNHPCQNKSSEVETGAKLHHEK